MSETVPPRLAQIIEDFGYCEGREKIELLIQFSQSLPPLPGWLQAERARMEAVPECMTPVFIQFELQGAGMVFYFDVPPESPTVRGFAAVLKQGLDGCTPEQVLQTPGDFYLGMGLENVLTHQRLNGIGAILAHIKQLAVKALELANNQP